MALQKNITDEYGATHTAAYARIARVEFMSGSSVLIDLQIYHDAAARSKADPTAVKPFFANEHYQVRDSEFTTYFAETVLDDASKTLLTQAYAYVKAQTAPINFTTGTTDV